MIVVTGGTGFLGGAIVRQLVARGESVRSVQRSDSSALRALGVAIKRTDLSDDLGCLAALQGADAVIHTAAKVGAFGSDAEFYSANVQATLNVIAACKTMGIRRLIYTSASTVVGAAVDVAGVDESAPVAKAFRSAYPRTKAVAEARVLAANSDKLATVALRLHHLWGPGDAAWTARLIARARAGRLRHVAGGDKRIDSLYIDNAAAAHLAALDRLQPGAPCSGRAYFIGQGEPLRQRDLVDAILTAAGLPACDSTLTPRQAWWLGLALELVWTLLGRSDQPAMTRYWAEHLTTAHWADLNAARRDLGYSPQLSVSEGLKRLQMVLAPGPESAQSESEQSGPGGR